MAQRYFSKAAAGFYDEESHGRRMLLIPDPAWQAPPDAPDSPHPQIEVINPACQIPPDAVNITDAEHAALLTGQAEGKIISADVAGRPFLSVRPPATFSALKSVEIAAFRVDRGKMLDCLSGLAGRFARAGDTASALACDALAQGLLDLPAFPSVAAAADLPALKAAMKARYNTLLAAVPAPVMAAYKGVTA